MSPVRKSRRKNYRLVSNGVRILIIGYGKLTRTITAYTKTHLAQIKKVVPQAKISLTADPIEVKKLLPDAEIIITSPFLQHLIDLKTAKNLKWIHSSSAGVTDLAKILLPTKIILTNSSGVHPIPISEHVLAFMLMFARQIHKAHRAQVKEKRWIKDVEALAPFELASSTVGIVGYGRIGARVAKVAKALGAKVAALEHKHKVYKVHNVHKVYKDVGQLLKTSDFVINCLPLTSETAGYFDLKKFRIMSRGAGSASGGKRSAYFINIGRGKTVVERDLIRALKENVIAGAGLDVFETEPLPENSPLWKFENVIITPHYSGWTPHYTDRVMDIFCSNLKAYLEKKAMPNLVDKKKGY